MPSRYLHEPKIAFVPEAPVPTAPPSAIAAADCSVGSGNRRCGRERWCQKTDNLVDEINSTPVGGHCEDNGDLDLLRRTGPERSVFEIVGVIDAVKSGKDRDLHIVLLDPGDNEWHMVAELVDPKCPGAKVSGHKPLLQAALQAFDDALGDGDLDALQGTKVRIRGVGFYDRWHGQTGMAESRMELHPVIHFEVVN